MPATMPAPNSAELDQVGVKTWHTSGATQLLQTPVPSPATYRLPRRTTDKRSAVDRLLAADPNAATGGPSEGLQQWGSHARRSANAQDCAPRASSTEAAERRKHAYGPADLDLLSSPEEDRGGRLKDHQEEEIGDGLSWYHDGTERPEAARDDTVWEMVREERARERVREDQMRQETVREEGARHDRGRQERLREQKEREERDRTERASEEKEREWVKKCRALQIDNSVLSKDVEEQKGIVKGRCERIVRISVWRWR